MKRKIEVVVIDNWISPTAQMNLTGKEMQVWQAEHGKCVPQADISQSCSHGTICASILTGMLPEAFAAIGYSCPGEGGKAEIDKVCSALKNCQKSAPPYLSLSIGTSNWLEAGELGRLTKELAEAGTQIFAACANNGHLAFPAAYPWVTGVRYEPGVTGFYREENSPVGSNLVVGDFTTPVLEKLAAENSFFQCRTNSMAAPYALGRMLSDGWSIGDLPLWTRPEPTQRPSELPMPVAALQGPMKKMQELLALFQQESYQAVLLTDRQETDWESMTVHTAPEAFFGWAKSLEEAGIILLDIEGRLNELKHYADYAVSLAGQDIKTAYGCIVNF